MPSLEGALRELSSWRPVHDAVRAAITDWSRDGEPRMDAAARVVDAIADATGTAGDRSAVVGRILDRYTAALRLDGEIDDASQTAALLVWSLLSPLGTLPEGAMVGPTSRAWYEELRLAPVVADALRVRGLDEGAAWWAAERVHTLLDLPIPSWLEGPEATLPLRLVDAWLTHPAVRPFIRVNAWDGVEWFHRESWDELVAWVDRLEWILAPEPARAERPAPPSALEAALTAAADASAYRIDLLREALGAEPQPEPQEAIELPPPGLELEAAPAPEPEPGPEPAPAPEPEPGPEPGPASAPRPKKAQKLHRPPKVEKGKKPRKK